MAYDVPEFVTDDCGLLPFGQVLIERNNPPIQQAFPESIDRGQQANKINQAVQFFCDSIRGGGIMSCDQILDAERNVHRLHLFCGDVCRKCKIPV